GCCVHVTSLPSAGTGLLVPTIGSLEDEREDEAEESQRLGERESGKRDGLQHAAGLGLTGDAVDVGGEDQADADARADRREAVAEECDVAFHVSLFLSLALRAGARVS